MPSNKQRDLRKVEKTGKSELVFDAVSICPVMENGKIVFKIMKIGFTLNQKCVTLEEIARADDIADALTKFQVCIARNGSLDIEHLRSLVKTVKEDNEKTNK